MTAAPPVLSMLWESDDPAHALCELQGSPMLVPLPVGCRTLRHAACNARSVQASAGARSPTTWDEVLINVGIVLELLPCEKGTIRLRRLDLSDAEDYAAGAEDDLVRRFGHLPLDQYTPEVVKQQIHEAIDPGLRAGTLAVLAIADVESDDFLGSAVLFDIEGDQAEVGYWVAPWARGRAVATHAVVALVEVSASSGIRRLVAKASPENVASQRVLTNAGFSQVGEPREERTPSGRLATVLTYSRSQRDNARIW